MGTPRNSARGSGRHQLPGTARPRAGADIQRLRRHYGAVREKDRRQAALRARAAQAAIAIHAVAIATAIALVYAPAPAGMGAPALITRHVKASIPAAVPTAATPPTHAPACAGLTSSTFLRLEFYIRCVN